MSENLLVEDDLSGVDREPLVSKRNKRMARGNNVQEKQFLQLETGVSSPWWSNVFFVFVESVKLAMLPIYLLMGILDIAVSLIIVGLVVGVGAWYLGVIPDDAVASVISELVQRAEGILQKVMK